MKNQRPVWFSPLSIKLPVGGVVSLLHRFSGVLLFLSLPFFLYLLQESLASQGQYHDISTCFGGGLKIGLLLLGWAVLHHVLAGIRVMLMDVGVGKDLISSRRSAKAVLWFGLVILLAWCVSLC